MRLALPKRMIDPMEFSTPGISSPSLLASRSLAGSAALLLELTGRCGDDAVMSKHTMAWSPRRMPVARETCTTNHGLKRTALMRINGSPCR